MNKRHKKTSHKKSTVSGPVSSPPPPDPVSTQGIYTEYLERGLNPDQLLAERKIQLKRISELRDGRAVLVYAADIKKPMVPNGIDSTDLIPIEDQIATLQGDRLDFILETGGGFGDAAEDIVKLLRGRFSELNIIVPGTAKSAGTIIAMAGDDILMEPISALGPIDAQIVYQGKQFSAEAFIKGLDDIKDEAARKQSLNLAYIPILQTISPGEIRNAQNAMEFAQKLVREWLVKYKFKNWTHRKRTGEEITPDERKKRADDIAKKLSEHSQWLTHSRSIKIDDLRDMELEITDYSEQPDLADAIKRYRILLQITFESTNIYKIFETPTSQIARLIVAQLGAPLPGNTIPKNAKSINIDLNCDKCNTINKIQARFTKTEPLKAGFRNFPANNKINCTNCGTELDLAEARKGIEGQIGKKIVS
jgi:hypothetical protein